MMNQETAALDRLRENTRAGLAGVATVLPRTQIHHDPPAVVATSVEGLVSLSRCIDVLHGRYRLTIRERDVLRLVLLGQSNDEIADTLGVALRTAKTHIEHIWTKLGVTSRARLMGKLFTEAA